MFDESPALTVLAENDCDEYEDGQKQFLAQFVAAKPRCGGLPNTKANLWKLRETMSSLQISCLWPDWASLRSSPTLRLKHKD